MKLTALDQQLIQIALREDLDWPFSDITTDSLFADINFSATAKIISKNKSSFILCGLFLIPELQKSFSSTFNVTTAFNDGDVIAPQTCILTLEGPLKVLLKVERVLLNFLQHLSGVATLTHLFVDRVKHTELKILDTRKTIPGFRHLDKYAVHCGGGVNHRMGLYDAILIKDNHIDLAGGIEKLIAKLPETKSVKTIIEVRTFAELECVLQKGLAKIDRILLDNMNVEQLREAVLRCAGEIPTEASGNLNLENILAVAETGVGFASIGKLTHTPLAIDLSMQI